MSEALFTILPLDRALGELCPTSPIAGEAYAIAGETAAGTVPELAAAIWLYVDDLNRSHTISQGLSSATGAYWHGIMHRREGDFSNAKYWFRRVGAHPVIDLLGYDPFEFVDRVSRDFRGNPADLVETQRREWQALYDWCKRDGATA